MSEKSGDLLIASPARWDEACFAVPAVRALLGSGWGVSILCGSHQESFWQTIAGLPVLSAAPNESPRALSKRIGDDWRSAIVWEDGKLAQAIRKTKIPRSIGPRDEKWAKWISDPMDLNPQPKTHRVEYYLSTANSLGQNTRDASLFEPAIKGQASHPLLLVPDSDFGPSYEWAIERWIDLSKRLNQEGMIYQIGRIPGGRNLGETLAEKLNIGGIVDISLSGDALGILADHAITVAADGSVPHLAAHAGVTCVTLFGPGDPVIRRPLGRRHTVVRNHVECAPCSLPSCPMDGRCQNELSVERVIAVVCSTTGGK